MYLIEPKLSRQQYLVLIAKSSLDEFANVGFVQRVTLVGNGALHTRLQPLRITHGKILGPLYRRLAVVAEFVLNELSTSENDSNVEKGVGYCGALSRLQGKLVDATIVLFFHQGVILGLQRVIVLGNGRSSRQDFNVDDKKGHRREVGDLVNAGLLGVRRKADLTEFHATHLVAASHHVINKIDTSFHANDNDRVGLEDAGKA